MIENCINIARNFKLETDVFTVEVIKDGYINDTYLLFDKAVRPCYVLQRINTRIFKDPEALAGNKFRVSNVLKGKGLEFIPSRQGKAFYRDEQNGFWMMSRYIPDSKTLKKPVSTSVAKKSGETIGEFHRAVVYENPADYKIIIPDFHNLTKRYKAFLTSVRRDAYEKAGMARKEIDFLGKAAKDYFFLDELIKNQKIPQRVVHYDTKLSNILFSKKSDPICLIDYDTVMPGTWLFDFADAARSICNSSEEDEQNLKKVEFLHEHFEALKVGYLRTIEEYLNREEKEQLNTATGYLILEQAIRFLDDFLRGDMYYKTEFDGQNLQRARVQIILYQDFIKAIPGARNPF